MKKWIWPKVLAFLALFWIFVSLFSVWILFMVSPSNNTADSGTKPITQEDLNRMLEEYQRTSSGVLETGTWVSEDLNSSSWTVDSWEDVSTWGIE